MPTSPAARITKNAASTVTASPLAPRACSVTWAASAATAAVVAAKTTKEAARAREPAIGRPTATMATATMPATAMPAAEAASRAATAPA